MIVGSLASSLLTDMLLVKKAEGLLEQEKKQLKLVMDLKHFDSPPMEKL